MPSPKVIQILRSRSTLSDEEIASISDDEGWAIITQLDNEKRAARLAARKPTVCFTGFSANEKPGLEAMASSKGLKVVGSVTKSLDYLVLGDTPGESKIEKAREQGAKVVYLQEFIEILSE